VVFTCVYQLFRITVLIT